MKGLAGLRTRWKKYSGVVELEICEGSQWRSAVDRWIYGSRPQEQGKRENCTHIQIGWMKFPKGNWRIRSEKGTQDRTVQDRENEIGPTGKPRSRKRNVTGKMATFIEHYLVMTRCQHCAKWFFMNYPFTTYADRCYYYHFTCEETKVSYIRWLYKEIENKRRAL